MLRQGLLLAAIVALASAQTFSFGHCPTTHTMENFDLNSYIGDWYELYKFPASFETGEKCIVANYSLTPENHIRVKNTGIDPKSGNRSIAFGDAFQSDLNSPAKLKIRFAANTPYGNYWVLKTDYTSYTLIYSCTDILGISHLEFAWILSRQRSLPQAKIDELFNVFKGFRIDTGHFIKCDQTGC
ncbi:apolipoprotein D-like [Argopecten irradians]|uniref:apolipoprotein D-like n=1 Tax=Argopecten irradians TaxID=31199 RepID=UPI003711D095